jgi:ABC transport system ATP-binding/permease protein
MISEKTLTGLLQIFAIVARPDTDRNERRKNVKKFLEYQLNQVGVKKWLEKFDKAVENEQLSKAARELKRIERLGKRVPGSKRKIAKPTPLTNHERFSVVKIIDQIGSDLPLDLKIAILIQLLELCQAEGPGISDLQLDIISGVANIINISANEVTLIKQFVLNHFSTPPESSNVLILSDNEKQNIFNYSPPDDKECNQFWFLYLESGSSVYFRVHGPGEITILGQHVQQDKTYFFPGGSFIRNSDNHNSDKQNPDNPNSDKQSPDNPNSEKRNTVNRSTDKYKIYHSDILFDFKKRSFENSRILYEVRDIEYRFKSGNTGFNKMSFSEESGKLVGIMGASGSGKSTLLNVLNGLKPPYSGEVLINGINIYEDKDKVKGMIGFVSQDDLLFEELTVYENLYYNAKLCFDNLSENEINERVDKTLKSLGLYERRDQKVGNPVNPVISGGQRKRLNISLELIREPAILFLDEPTSGLSSGDSENILELLEELTNRGKLVFVVIHQPSSDIFKMFDRLIILDVDTEENDGGYMIFNGSPLDSLEFFKMTTNSVNYTENECYACHNVNAEQIFNIVEARVLDGRGKPTSKRQITSKQWHADFLNYKNFQKLLYGSEGAIPEICFRIPGWLKQVRIFSTRDFRSKLSDLQYVLITLIEAPVLAFLLSFLIRYSGDTGDKHSYVYMNNENIPVYLFMSVIVAIFMGMILSAEEIIKSRKILKRESFLNLSWDSFLISKIIVQFSISGIQALLYVLVGNSILEIRGMTFEYWLILFSCWASSNVVGLLISDSFKVVVTIYIVIPLLVIPQILLSGIIVKYEKLNPDISAPSDIPFYGEMITSRWGYEALAVYQFRHNKFEEKLYNYDRDISRAKFMRDYWSNTMRSKLMEISADLNSGRKGDNLDKNMRFVRNEIRKKSLEYPGLNLEPYNNLNSDKITPEIVSAALGFTDNIRNAFVKKYSRAFMMKDSVVTNLELKDKSGLLRTKETCFNSSLSDFVTNANAKINERVLEYKDDLIQKVDPVFLYPDNRFIKAHFYAPVKMFFGTYLDTCIVNLIVIWAMTILVYLALRFRILKQFLEFSEKSFTRKVPGKNG